MVNKAGLIYNPGIRQDEFRWSVPDPVFPRLLHCFYDMIQIYFILEARIWIRVDSNWIRNPGFQHKNLCFVQFTQQLKDYFY